MPNVGPIRDPVWAVFRGSKGPGQMQFMAHSWVKGPGTYAFVGSLILGANMHNVGPIGGPLWAILRGVYLGGLQGPGAHATHSLAQ